MCCTLEHCSCALMYLVATKLLDVSDGIKDTQTHEYMYVLRIYIVTNGFAAPLALTLAVPLDTLHMPLQLKRVWTSRSFLPSVSPSLLFSASKMAKLLFCAGTIMLTNCIFYVMP